MKRRYMIILTLLLAAPACLSARGLSQTQGKPASGTFAKKLQLHNLNTISYKSKIVNGNYLAEEDILLGPASGENAAVQSRGAGYGLASSLWQNGIVPYQFPADFSDQATQARVLEAIQHWNLNSSIRLVERNASNASQLPDYIEFVPSTGCASYVGRVGGKQELWVAPACQTGSIIHEIGHALGLLHEHTRIDRDSYIVVNYDNVREGKEHNFAIPQGDTRDLGAYDYESIMHYSRYAFSSNGLATITPVADIGDIDMGQRDYLSNGDIQSINEMYGTDLHLDSVMPEFIAADEPFSIEADVTNIGTRGASEVLVIVDLDDSNQLDSYGGEGWECRQHTTQILCGRSQLGDYQQSILDLQFLAASGTVGNIDITLTSRTWDYDLSNNGPLGEDFSTQIAHDSFFSEPMDAAAYSSSDGGSSTTTASAASSAGGGGSENFLNLFLLGMLFLLRKSPLRQSS